MKLLLDEHITPALKRGLLRLLPQAEVVEVSQTMPGTSDPELLEWAAANGFLLVSQDRNTLIGFYYERLEAGLDSTGLFILRRGAPLGEVIESLALILETSETAQWHNQVRFIPL